MIRKIEITWSDGDKTVETYDNQVTTAAGVLDLYRNIQKFTYSTIMPVSYKRLDCDGFELRDVKNKTQYEIKSERFRFSIRGDENSAPSLSSDEIKVLHEKMVNRDIELFKFFDSLQDAEKEFQSLSKHNFTHAEYDNALWLVVGDACWIDAVEYGDNGEIVRVNTIEFAAQPYNAE